MEGHDVCYPENRGEVSKVRNRTEYSSAYDIDGNRQSSPVQQCNGAERMIYPLRMH
jgi:hypothetical protein